MAVHIKGDPVANAAYYNLYEKVQSSIGDNLIVNTGKSSVDNGITFTVNSDGSVTAYGSCIDPDPAIFTICNLASFNFEAGTYYLSGCPDSDRYTFKLTLDYKDSSGTTKQLVDTGEGKSVTIPSSYESDTFKVTISIIVDPTLGGIEGVTFKPMLSTKANAEFKSALGTVSYNNLTTSSEINFDVASLGLEKGDHTLVVKAVADGYIDSDYSNEVVYTQS